MLPPIGFLWGLFFIPKRMTGGLMRYKAVFFDRDNTLTYFNPQKKA